MPFARLGLGLVLLGACRGPHQPASDELAALREALPPAPRANVIVLSFDALRADELAAYGGSGRATPNLDAFAQGSLVLENAYTVAPVTPSSFAAAFTGMLPTRVFAGWQLVGAETLAARFAAAGYTTAALINSVQLTPERGFDRGFARYDWHRNLPHDEFFALADGWLRDLADSEAPVLAWVHFLVPHAPYEYRAMASAFYSPGYEGPFLESSGVTFEAPDLRSAARVRELYEGQVFYTDDAFGALVAGLEESGILEDSIVVVTADHGEEFLDHGGFQHGRLYEEHSRVPLLIRHPAVDRGTRSPVLVSNVDLLPTLLSIVGAPVDDPLDGRDLTALRSPPALLVGISMTGGKERSVSVRHGTSKLILDCRPEPRARLFDLEADPGEERDLAAREPDRVRQLARGLETILGGQPCDVVDAAIQGKPQTVGLDESSVESLRALGYLDG